MHPATKPNPNQSDAVLEVNNSAHEKLYLHPGQLFASRQSHAVTTILGSCVAVCLWDPLAKIAGVNHFLLPSIPASSTKDARYGNTAMQRLVDDIVSRGASKNRLMAKIFGGANVILAFAPKKPIGTQNVGIAREVLGKNGIEIVAEETDGRRGPEAALRHRHRRGADQGGWDDRRC